MSVCYPLPNAHTDRMTLGEYRARYADTYRHLESWTVLDGAEPIEDRVAPFWGARS